MSNKTGIRKKINGGVSIASILSCLYCGSTAAIAGNFVEPPVFASANGVLALLMIAKPAPIPSISFSPPDAGAIIHPTGWVYEICPLLTANANQCPSGAATGRHAENSACKQVACIGSYQGHPFEGSRWSQPAPQSDESAYARPSGRGACADAHGADLR